MSYLDMLSEQAIQTITEVFSCTPEDIDEVEILKKGMTNHSYLISVKGEKYIFRTPGEGTDKLISRKNEYDSYHTIKGKDICDDPVYINPENGYKITRYINNVRVCDPENIDDVKVCMKKLREFHDLKLSVNHTFDLFGMIEYYESLWTEKSVYEDYIETKANVLSMQAYIKRTAKPFALAHIDSVCDNFLFERTDDGIETLQLTDWEYAGMQDQDVDIAMFSIYCGYDKEHIDQLIDIYYENNCPIDQKIKIYCYVAASGLLWSNWCEYKRDLGVDFGDYAVMQYDYARDYFRIANEELYRIGDTF